tara:strand:+ start:268 stop:627 length:360 start_codon:yes stop_codon:yes gene_type:complete
MDNIYFNLLRTETFNFTPPEVTEKDRRAIPQMMYAEVNSRSDRRAVEKEYNKASKTLLVLENSWVEEMFMIEAIDEVSYKELYTHYLRFWQKEVNALKKKFKHIIINHNYFSETYKPVA